MKQYLRYLNALIFIAMIYVNYSIGFVTSIESNSLFTPSNYVFKIWILIYILLFLFVIYQVLPSQRDNEYIENIGVLFILTSLLNILWLIAWNKQEYFAAWLILLIYFISLSIVYSTLDIGKCCVSLFDRLLIQIPFSVYYAWITVAFIANTIVVVNYYNIFDNNYELLFTLGAVIVTVAFGVILTSNNNDIVFLFVLIWALIGIIRRHYGSMNIISIVVAVGVIILLFQSYLNLEKFLCLYKKATVPHSGIFRDNKYKKNK